MDDKRVAVKGGLWTGVSIAATLFAQLVRVMILTRFLDKSDFGIVALTSMVIGLCVTFTDLGFASVIMYKQALTDKEFSTLYWIQMIFYLTIYCVISFFSPLIASFYNEYILITLIPLAGMSIIFQSIGKLYDSVLQKRYYFKQMAIRNIIANSSSLFLAWLLAYLGHGVYSLVFSTLFQVLIYNIWNFITGLRLQKLVLYCKIKEVVPLIKIGIYQTGTNLLDYIADKIDVIIIGKVLGTEVLGLYDLAKELVIKFLSFFKAVVSKVALPILANNNTDDEVVKSRFLVITKTMAYISIPICITLATFSKEAIQIVYGEKFIEVAPLVSIFAIMGIVNSLISFFDMLAISKGRTDLNFLNTVCRLVLSTIIIYLTSRISVFTVSCGQLLTSLIMSIIVWNLVVKKTYPLSVMSYFSQFFVILCVMAFIAGIVNICRMLLPLIFLYSWGDSLMYILLYIVLVLVSCKYFLKSDVQFIIGLIKTIKH